MKRFLLVAMLLTLLVTACGGSGASPDTAVAPPASGEANGKPIITVYRSPT